MDDRDAHFRLEQARQAFLTSGSVDPAAVPDLVAASWRRSLDAGVDPGADALDSTYLDDLDLQSRFVHCALPVIDRLQREIGDLPVSIVLTDSASRLLVRRDGDRSLANRLESVLFAPGFSYAEDIVGTNGVGTTLEAGQAVFIRGAEHFSDLRSDFACAGAPIRDPLSRTVQGVLDLSCLAKDSSPVMRVLVVEAVQDIESALWSEGGLRQKAVLDRFLYTSRHGRSSVLSYSGGVFMLDARATSVLSPLDQSRLRETATELLGARDGTVLYVELPSGRYARVRHNLVTVGTDVAGTVLQVDFATPSGAAKQVRTAGPTDLAGAPGKSAEWRNVCGEIVDYAHRVRPLIVTGEPGTGKSTLVAAAHRRVSPASPLIVVDCRAPSPSPEIQLREESQAAVPTIMLEHLDEISDERINELEHQLWPVSQSKPHGWVVASVCSAPSAQRPALDLLLRHFAGSVSVPALRHHIDDLRQLVPHLLAKLAPRRTVTCTPEAMRVLFGYDWPGNIAELQDALRSALRRRPVGDIKERDLPETCFASSRRVLTPIETVERDAIVRALVDAGGNRVKAAEALGIARSSLYRKIEAYGIRPLR